MFYKIVCLFYVLRLRRASAVCVRPITLGALIEGGRNSHRPCGAPPSKREAGTLTAPAGHTSLKEGGRNSHRPCGAPPSKREAGTPTAPCGAPPSKREARRSSAPSRRELSPKVTEGVFYPLIPLNTHNKISTGINRETGFAPLAARPGAQPTGLCSLRPDLIGFRLLTQTARSRSRLHPQIPLNTHNKISTGINARADFMELIAGFVRSGKRRDGIAIVRRWRDRVTYFGIPLSR